VDTNWPRVRCIPVARPVEVCLQLALLGTGRLVILQQLLQPLLRLAPGLGAFLLAEGRRLELFTDRYSPERVALEIDPLLLLEQQAQAIVQLLDSGTLDHRLLAGIGCLAREGLPALLPGGQQRLGLVECRLRAGFDLARSSEGGLEFLQRGHQRIDLPLVAGQDRLGLGLGGRGLLEVGLLAGAEVACELEGLLGAGDLCTELVVTTLHASEGLLTGARRLARLLDGRFGGTQRGHRGLQREFAFAEGMSATLGLGVEVAQAQGEQLGMELALLLLVALVPARGRCLALEVP